MTQENIDRYGEHLQAKITSKFTASTFLAGFALTVLTGQIAILWQADLDLLSPFFPYSVGAVAGACCLFVFAVIRLDELTMPKLFWFYETKEPEPDVPSENVILNFHDLWIQKWKMVEIWQRLTIPATIITAIALVAMLIPSEMIFGFAMSVPDIRFWTPVVVLVCSVVAVAYSYIFAPAIGGD